MMNTRNINKNWDKYVNTLSNEYGKHTKLIWISKRRRKYILEFAHSGILVINDEIFQFKDILSCRMEKAPYIPEIMDNASEPFILLIGTACRTNMLISLTVWGERTSNMIYKTIQEIIQSNMKAQ